MNKYKFIARNKKFIDFISSVICGDVLVSHSYLDEAFKFETLEDAFDTYLYPFKSTSSAKYKSNPDKWRAENLDKAFPANKAKLEEIKTQLRREFLKESPNAGAFYDAMKKALYWGATGEIVIPQNTNRQGTYSANIKWLEQQYNDKNKLLENFKLAVEAIESENFNSAQFGKSALFRMNAGFTKIYALLSNESIIYDGRVGAALGYLVTEYLKRTGDEFTGDIAFLWGKSESKSRQRDPSIPEKNWIFESLSNSKEGLWADSNVRANWVLTAAIDQLPSTQKFGGYSKHNMLHAIEASLFMLGYDFPQYPKANKMKTVYIKAIQQSSKSKKITNHEKLFSYIKSNLMGTSDCFTYSDIVNFANKVIPDASKPGKQYAALKFIKTYCTVLDKEIDAELKQSSDPRNIKSLNSLKRNCRFELIL